MITLQKEAIQEAKKSAEQDIRGYMELIIFRQEELAEAWGIID